MYETTCTGCGNAMTFRPRRPDHAQLCMECESYQKETTMTIILQGQVVTDPNVPVVVDLRGPAPRRLTDAERMTQEFGLPCIRCGQLTLMLDDVCASCKAKENTVAQPKGFARHVTRAVARLREQLANPQDIWF